MVFQGSIYISIQRTKGANIHNNIQTVIFTGVLYEVFKLILNTQWQSLINPGHLHSIKKCTFEKKYDKRHLKHNVHGSLRF